MSNGFERRKEQSREDIRRAAWELFAQFGVARVSVSDIARKAGVSPATIYNNFESKDELVREFTLTVVGGLVDAVQRLLAADRPFHEKVRAFVAFIADVSNQGAPLEAGTTVFASSADLQHDPEIRQIRDAAREKMTELLLGLAAEGRAAGEVNRDVSDEALRIYFQAFMDVFIDPQVHRRLASNARLVDELAALLIGGLNGPRS